MTSIVAFVSAVIGLFLVAGFVARFGWLRTTVGVLAIAFLTVEELFASARNTAVGALDAPWFTRLGYQLADNSFFVHLSILSVLALASAPVLLLVNRARPDANPWPRNGVVVWATLLAVSAFALGSSPVEAGKTALPAALVLSGILVGRLIATFDARAIEVVVTGWLFYKAAIALLSVIGFGHQGPAFVLYYDALTPSISGAVLVAGLLSSHRRSLVALMTPAFFVVILSPRRTPLLVAIVLLLVLPVVMRRAKAFRRSFVIGTIVGSAVLGKRLLPLVVQERITRAQGALTYTGDSSVQGHYSDLSVGFAQARDQGFFGLGPHAEQLPGLAASQANAIYVHNEYLQVWLKFGVPGLLGLLFLVAVAVRCGWNGIRPIGGIGSFDLRTICGAFLLATPIALFFFPYLTTTARWPFAFGLAMGVVTLATGRRLPGERKDQAAALMSVSGRREAPRHRASSPSLTE